MVDQFALVLVKIEVDQQLRSGRMLTDREKLLMYEVFKDMYREQEALKLKIIDLEKKASK